VQHCQSRRKQLADFSSLGWAEHVNTYTSNQHLEVKALRRLVGRRLSRSEAGVCIVEGEKVLAEATAGGVEIVSLFLDGDFESALITSLMAKGVRVRRLAPGSLASIVETVTPQPVVAVVKSPLRMLTDLLPLPAGLVVVGVGIQDPGNAGTMIRSAELSGAVAVVFTGNSVDATSPKVVRSSVGALFHIPVVQNDDTETALQLLRASRFRLLGTAVRGDAIAYSDGGVLGGSVAIVMGNEGQGLSESAAQMMDGWITIPMLGRTESLNVGMATSVLCFESARQRSAQRADEKTPNQP
jgi:RNA methyltransferase, TrmH family